MPKHPENKPPFWCRNGHVQTIVPTLFRKIHDVRYERERIRTPDDDFLDLDWSCSGGKTLAVISHGLEGSSDRAYVQGMVKAFNKAHISGLAWNFRGCSGESNRQLRMYHSGSTDDLDVVIRHAMTKGYNRIFLVGFSMGANINLLYAGQQAEHILPEIKGVVGLSAPLNLKDCALQIAHPLNTIYMKRFLKMLHEKIKEKTRRFPDQIDDKHYNEIKDFKAFDDRYTAPIHGFKSAEDYWEQCSCGPLLEKIQIPCLIVNAADDPFLSKSSYLPLHMLPPHISFETPKYGGHVGFMIDHANGKYFSEIRAVTFAKALESDTA